VRERLDALRRAFADALREAGASPAAVESVRVRFLGKKGELTALLKGLGVVSEAERPAAGAAINEVKVELETALENAKSAAAETAAAAALSRDRIDVTLPSRRPAEAPPGHPDRLSSSASSARWDSRSRPAPRSRTTFTTSRR
jgi:phenylalanyl-tRNA synthetase alpha chain